MVPEYVKENTVERPPVSPVLLVCALVASAAALAAVALIDVTLPAPLPRSAPPDRFSAEIAHEHLVNLTSIGPRVAGSYENEVAAVGVLVEAIKGIARAASPHNRVELDLHRASGSFALTFFDGMNNVYRDVQSVVARVRGAGGRSSRTQLLLNCHFDTVPDSPGASDDGAGCAVLLETMRALAAARRPLRHDAVFLLNGAEENIMQASHAFVTTHKWAKSLRAFINIEACGAGGREVLFQAGPHDPWIMEVYAGAVPHPFASSLAQELFESGLVPADTDFRIFRDFGRLSGVDLAWSANGYVYHTRLDTAARVPPSALQRTGDNVLALAHGLLSSESLESEVDFGSRQPVFFDVLGLFVVSARAPVALAAAGATLALVALKLHCSARDARAKLYMSCGAWAACVWRAALRVGGAGASGALGACAAALLLHAGGARLSFYSRGWLLAPLYALPALAAAAGFLAACPPPLPAARLVGGAADGRRAVRVVGRAAAGERAAAAALRLRAAAVGAAAGRGRPARARGESGRRRARTGVVRGLPAAGAADVVPGAGVAGHVRAYHGPRRRAGRAARRGNGCAGGDPGDGGVQLDSAAGGGSARRPVADVQNVGNMLGDMCAGDRHAVGRAVQRGAAAALHGVPRAARGARAGRRRHRPRLLAARAGRQHAALRRRRGSRNARGPGEHGGGVRELGILRRPVLPARAGLHPARPLAARAAARPARGRAHRAARAPPPPRRAHARAATQHHGAEPRGSDRVADGRGARHVEQRAGAAAGGAGVGRAPHLLPDAAHRAQPAHAPLGPDAAPRAAGAVPRVGVDCAAVGGGTRHERGARGGARAAAALVPGRRRAHRLACAPAPAARVAVCECTIGYSLQK